MTILPQPASTIAPTYACVTCNTAPRLRRIASSQSSGQVSTKSFSSPKPDVGIPALFTRMSIGPSAFSMASTAALTDASFVTSQAKPLAP